MDSKQSDIELLFYYGLIKYEEKHGLIQEEVQALFDKSHVFELMLSQHEYLHQIPIEEVMEYIESIVTQPEVTLRLFHGTTAVFENIDLSMSHNRRDFGVGFYTTVIRNQALEWAKQMKERRDAQKYYIYEYQYKTISELSILHFHAPDKDWLEFVKKNRIEGGCQHDYDIVIGPVADDKTMPTLTMYISNFITLEEAVNRLRYSLVNNQVSFHTQKALCCLTLVGRKEYV